jgi:hypothetical protein
LLFPLAGLAVVVPVVACCCGTVLSDAGTTVISQPQLVRINASTLLRNINTFRRFYILHFGHHGPVEADELF